MPFPNSDIMCFANKMNSRTRHEFEWRSGAKQHRNSRHECFRVDANTASGMHRDALLRFVNSCSYYASVQPRSFQRVCRVFFRTGFLQQNLTSKQARSCLDPTVCYATAPALRRSMIVMAFFCAGALESVLAQPPLSNKRAAAFA